jgi:hypothetical protein
VTLTSRSVLEWAAAAVGAGARVVGIEALRERPGERGPWVLHVEYGHAALDVVVKTGPADPAASRNTTTHVSIRSSMATEAEALTLAEAHRVPAPRLLAMDLKGEIGVVAILTTAIPRTSQVPDLASRRTLGATAAKLQAISLAPRPNLPLRTRPRFGDDYLSLRRWATRYQAGSEAEKATILDDVLSAQPHWSPDRARTVLERTQTTALIRAAEERLRRLPVPQGDTVFVHGDLCGGNTVWADDGTFSLIDWEGAGAGHYGLDLGNLRFEESLHFGLPAAQAVLEGWQLASGRDAGPLAYWDLVAALNTPADLTRWAPGLRGATARRDAFLRAALKRAA